MILLLDNYDSFTYNLAQYLGQMGQQLEVRRNDQITIEECMSRDPGAEFAILHSHFSGMATCRLGDIERTRIMELLGNRKATVPVDEIYGIMAASGIEIAVFTNLV